MSGGWVVVLDQMGRDVKRFPLESGMATLGSHPHCDIRIMLPSVSSHHATLAVHARQTVIRNVGSGETLVNGAAVSVAALRHGDRIALGGREMRWDYADVTRHRPLLPEPALRGFRAVGGVGRGARRRRGSVSPPRAPHRHLLRDSAPGNAGRKQVAIVQPQRRDTSEQNGENGLRSTPQPKRPRLSKGEELIDRRRTTTPAQHNATKASMWIESRKSAPRKSLRSPAQRRPKLTKIQDPLQIDQTKQVAIMLMTGHTPKTKLTPKKSLRSTPSIVTKKTPSRGVYSKSPRNSTGNSQTKSASVLELTDTESQASTNGSFRPSGASPLLPTPKKSAMKDPTAKKSSRKTESIKFDLSNLENTNQSNIEFKKSSIDDSLSENLALHYSESSNIISPSPRKSIHSRSSKILGKSLGVIVSDSSARSSFSSTRNTLTPRQRKSSRGSFIVQKALELSDSKSSRYSRRTTKSMSDNSYNTTVASGFQTRTLSPKTPKSPTRNNLETYSIVDLVSMDSESGKSGSIYNSADSIHSSDTVEFGTPNNSSGRKTRSTIDLALVESSTPYVPKIKKAGRSRSINNETKNTTKHSVSTRRSNSMTTLTITPENSLKDISMNSTKAPRRSRSRSRLNESDLLLITDSSHLEDESPRSSRSVKSSKSQASPLQTSKRSTLNKTSPKIQSQRKSSRKSNFNVTPQTDNTQGEGVSTPENRLSPEEVGTPLLSMQSLLNSSQNSPVSKPLQKNGRLSNKIKRKTIGTIQNEPKKTRSSGRSKSLNYTAKKGLQRLSKESPVFNSAGKKAQTEDKMVTPKSAVKLVQEAVKNRHSTAKKPQSKRSIIDTLDQSDIVKQLFNSPVKRKLSRSMTEYSRKQLTDEDEAEISVPADLDNSAEFTPYRFVSPISTPSASPNMSRIKRLFKKNTPENDLSNVSGVKTLLRSPRGRKSVHNDLTNVSGVKKVFGKSPRNRLSDVRVKEVFAAGPKNDLTRVSGVKSLFQSQKKTKSPKNDLSNVKGVKELFKKKSPANDLTRVSGVKRALQRNSPRNDLTDVRGVKNVLKRKSPVNDLRRVSGVKRVLQRNSPKNDLSDVRGVKRMFKQQKQKDFSSNVSGVEELFNESTNSVRETDILFDKLIGKPPIKAVYSKSFSKKSNQKSESPRNKSLQSIDLIPANVEEWLERELQKRLQTRDANKSSSRELQNLATDTVEGAAPIMESRARSEAEVVGGRKKSPAEVYSPRSLPIKKRSLVGAHSTPVKGRALPAHPAPPLGRISPIVAPTSSPRSEKQSKDISILNESNNIVNKSPQHKNVSQAKENKVQSAASPPKARSTRARKSNTQLKNVKILRASLSISKKTPVMSPKPAPRTRRGKTDKETIPKENQPKEKLLKQIPASEIPSQKTRKTQKKSKVTETAIVATPKKTRGRKNAEIPPKSPEKLGIVTKTTRNTRKPKQIVEKVPTPKKSATPKRNTRAKVQKTTVTVLKPSPKIKPQKPLATKTDNTKRVSRKTAATTDGSVERSSKRRKVESPKTRKDVKKTEIKNVEVTGRRGRKTVIKTLEPKKASTAKKVEEKPTRSRNVETKESVQSERSTRGVKRIESKPTLSEPRGRKRKSNGEEVVPSKISKTKASRFEAVETGEVRSKRSGKQKTETRPAQDTQVVKSRKAVGTEASQKKTETAKNKKTAETQKPAAKTRRAKAEVAPSPVKVSPKKLRGQKASPVKATRAKGKANVAPEKPVGRSRRR